jgi:hypothetical protein
VDRVVTGGGSLILAGLIDQAGEAIFQDFQDVYGLNLIKMFRDDVPPGEILLLIRGLKVGSRFVAVLRGRPEFAVNYVTYAVIAANSKRKPKTPKPSFRPAKAGRKPTNAFATQLEMAKKRKARGG